jgi:hypothetical protein
MFSRTLRGSHRKLVQRTRLLAGVRERGVPDHEAAADAAGGPGRAAGHDRAPRELHRDPLEHDVAHAGRVDDAGGAAEDELVGATRRDEERRGAIPNEVVLPLRVQLRKRVDRKPAIARRRGVLRAGLRAEHEPPRRGRNAHHAHEGVRPVPLEVRLQPELGLLKPPP